MKIRSLFVSTALVTSLIGCGGEAPPSEGPFEPTIAPDRSIASLTDAEASTYCSELGSYRRARVSDAELQRIACTIFGVAFSPDPASCDAQVAACVGGGGLEETCGASDPTRSTCELPIEVMSTCSSLQIEQLATRGSEITCALAGDAEALEALMEAPPEACARLMSECPDFVGGV